MSEMQHFPKFSYVSGNIRVELSLDRFSKQFKEAQQWLGDRVLEDCKPYMPHLTGNFQQRSHTENGGARVVFPGPYARYLYMGKVMVDKVTGRGPMKIYDAPGGSYILRYREGAELIPTDRPLQYTKQHHPQATDHWFDAAKAKHQDYWIDGAGKILGGKNVY